MIKNERQYKITKSQARKLEETLNGLEKESIANSNIDSVLLVAQKEAIKSQFEELLFEIEEFESIRDKRKSGFLIKSITDIPRVLIQARIALGLSQKELGNRLGMKEQQIQRYESTDYSSVSLSRIAEISKVLRIKFNNNVCISKNIYSLHDIVNKLNRIGIDKDVLLNSVIPKIHTINIKNYRKKELNAQFLKTIEIINRIFRFSFNSLMGYSPLEIDMSAFNNINLKVPINSNKKRLNTYIMFAHYLALLVLESTKYIKQKKIPANPTHIRKDIINHYGSITLKNVVEYIWDLGIPIIPLYDKGAFHGACWFINKRYVVVIKQKTSFESRWVFDLLHELWHIVNTPKKDDYAIIETLDNKNTNSEEEQANQFAADILLDCRAEELIQMCVNEASGKVENLKSSIPKIAQHEKVNISDLANYMAYRLSLQNIDWWGTAHNLQGKQQNPYAIVYKTFFNRFNFNELNDIDKEILVNAISVKENINNELS